MIKAIIFDFYGVLCSEKYWQQLKKDPRLGPNFSEMARDLHLGELSWGDFINQIATESHKSREEVVKAYAAEKINLPLVDYISQLRESYKIGLLSNAAYEAFEPRGKEIGFNKLFDYTAVSSQIGMIKPDPKIYDYILQKLNVRSKEAVYIDDSLRLVEAAQKLGIKSIHYQNFEQMKAELEIILSTSSDD